MLHGYEKSIQTDSSRRGYNLDEISDVGYRILIILNESSASAIEIRKNKLMGGAKFSRILGGLRELISYGLLDDKGDKITREGRKALKYLQSSRVSLEYEKVEKKKPAEKESYKQPSKSSVEDRRPVGPLQEVFSKKETKVESKPVEEHAPQVRLNSTQMNEIYLKKVDLSKDGRSLMRKIIGEISFESLKKLTKWDEEKLKNALDELEGVGAVKRSTDIDGKNDVYKPNEYIQ